MPRRKAQKKQRKQKKQEEKVRVRVITEFYYGRKFYKNADIVEVKLTPQVKEALMRGYIELV